jgi:hypothetical protein
MTINLNDQCFTETILRHSQNPMHLQTTGAISPRLIAGLALLAIGLGSLMWLYQPTPTHPSSSLLPIQQSPDSKAKAVAEVNRLRRQAAAKFRELAGDHEASARQRLAKTITQRVEQSRQREDAYADWLLSTGATLKLAKAWYDDRLAEMLDAATEERMLSRRDLAEAVNGEAESLRADLITSADEISRDYNDRIASALIKFDMSDRLKIEAIQLPRYSMKEMKGPTVASNVGSLANFIGAGFLGDYAGTTFVSWLGTKVAVTAGSDMAFADTGPVGWIAGLTVGVGAQWAVDKYWIKPRLLRELDSQLNSVKARLLAPNSPVLKLATDQADLAMQAATELEKPISSQSFESRNLQPLALTK